VSKADSLTIFAFTVRPRELGTLLKKEAYSKHSIAPFCRGSKDNNYSIGACIDKVLHAQKI